VSYKQKENEVTTKGTKTKKTVNGSDMISVSIPPDQVDILARLVSESATDRGVKLTIFTRDAEGSTGSFKSSQLYVDGIQAPRAPGAGGGQSKGRFVPKTSARDVLKGKTLE